MESKKYLHVLNGKTAAATALIMFNLGAAAVVAIVSLDGISDRDIENKELATVTAGLNVLLWAGLVSFPFIQVSLCLGGGGGVYTINLSTYSSWCWG